MNPHGIDTFDLQLFANVPINAASGPAIAADSGTRDGATEYVQIVRMDATLLPTYGVSYVGITGVAGIIFTLTGSATKTVKLRRLMVSGADTTAGAFDVTLVKYSAPITPGTTVAAATIVPFDSNNAAATATVAAYSSASTGGTSVGNIFTKKLQLVPNTISASVPVDVQFGEENEQLPTLRGTSQQFGVLLSALPAGGSLDVSAWWTEESNSF